MPKHFLTVSGNNKEILNESKNYQAQLGSRKSNIQSYNDTFINNYYQNEVLKSVTISQDSLQSHYTNKVTPITTIKPINENTNSKANFPTTADIISSPVSSTVDKTESISPSIFLSQNILNLINDIHDNINERITNIKNKNNEINREIIDKISTLRNNQHELIHHIINRFENKSTDETNDNSKTTTNNDNNKNNDIDNTFANSNEDKIKNENNNYESNNENINNNSILSETFSLIKRGNIELINRIESIFIYNINFLQNEFANHDQVDNREIINFTNSNGENKTLLFPKIMEILNDHDFHNSNLTINQSNVDLNEEKLEKNEVNDIEIKKDDIEKSNDHLKVNPEMKKCSSSSSVISALNVPIKRLMKATGIYKLPYLNSMVKQSSEEEIKSPKEKKNRKSIFKKKDTYLGNSIYDSDEDGSLYSSNEVINIRNNKSLKISASAEFKPIKNKRKIHQKSNSENIDFTYNAPRPISNKDNKKDENQRFSVPLTPHLSNDKENKKENNKRLSVPLMCDKNQRKEKTKEKEREKEMEKLKKEKEKELEKLKKEKEKENKEKIKKELIDKKKKKIPKTNLQKTNSVLEIERRLKNVFDNYNVKLIGRDETSNHPILTNAIADKILPHIEPSAYKEYRNWRLLYSLDCHGTHIQTMYDNVFEKSPLVIAVMDEDGCIFGAYSTDYFRSETHYYGNGQTFLWKYTVDENGNGVFNCFKATGSNHYYIISEKDYLAFGGGRGFGLHLSDHFTYGFTDNCETYNNEVLASKKDFKCINVEIWCLEI